jgi:hypothetical protein
MVVTRWLKLFPLDGASEFVIGEIRHLFLKDWNTEMKVYFDIFHREN